MKSPKDNTVKNPGSKSGDQNEENKTPGYAEEDIQNGMGKEEDVDTSESELTEDDLEALGPKDLSMDGGDDEDLAHRVHPADFSGKDLDVPGAELDDAQEDIGSEDEENNSYSFSNND
jgi:hypothetical protein